MVPKALAFGMNVLAFNPHHPGTHEPGVSMTSLPDLLARSDAVSLHLPLVPSTRGLFHREIFERMKPGSIFLNTSRGGLVIEDDLHASLLSGHLSGAGLDVFDREPPSPANPLLLLPHVVSSPHMGGVDTLAMSDMADMASRIIIDLHLGTWPEGCVMNSSIREGWTWAHSD